jgi:hypothetical protein
MTGSIPARRALARRWWWLTCRSSRAWKPTRNTVMVDFASSEFARLRFQVARDTSRGAGRTDNQVWLQYVMSLGAHGAHKF